MPVYELVGEIEEGGAAPEVAGLERRGARVRVLSDEEPREVGAFLEARVRGIEVREYPDADARAAWTDWGREGDGRAGGEEPFRREVAMSGPKPRVLAPLIAAGVMALSLERLGALHVVAAAFLFALLALFVVANELRRARFGVAFVRYVGESGAGTGDA